MNFTEPWILMFLIPLPALWWLYLRRNRSKGDFLRSVWLVCSIATLIFSLAHPYWRMIPTQRIVRGVDLIVILDVSQSMFCKNDSEPSRIDQARLFLRRLLSEFSGSPVSILYFAGDTQIGSPFTTDLQAIHLFLDSVSPGMTTQPGTRSSPLGKALDRLLSERVKSSTSSSSRPLVLLFSDGEFFDSTGPFQASLRRHPELRLYSFLCGTAESPVPKFDLSGNAPDAISKTQPESLKRIAMTTGGNLFEISKTSIETVASEVTQQVSTFIAEGEMVPEDRSIVFILVAFLFLLAYRFSSFVRFVSWKPAVALLVVSSLLTSTGMSNSPFLRFQEATRDARSGKLDQALKKLQQLQKEHPGEEISIAIGNIYFHQGKFEEAIRHYKEALSLDNSNLTARWNWEVALKKQSPSSSPPPPPSPKKGPAPEAPQPMDRTDSLLKYFDQLEKEQMQQQNQKNQNQSEFAW